MNPRYPLTITGSGSLTTQSDWFDFWITGCEMTIDNTTLESKGDISIGDNSAFDGDNLIVKKSTFKGRRLYGLTGLTLINCAFKSSQEILFEPENYYNLKRKHNQICFRYEEPQSMFKDYRYIHEIYLEEPDWDISKDSYGSTCIRMTRKGINSKQYKQDTPEHNISV